MKEIFSGMNWQSIIPFSLLGSEQSEWSEELQELSQRYGVDKGLDPAVQLLRILAIGIKQEQLRAPLVWEGPVSLPESGSPDFQAAFDNAIPDQEKYSACPTEVRSVIPFHYGKDPLLNKEIQDLLISHKYWAPPELLPTILQEAYNQPLKWTTLLPLAGPLGIWLARQHSNWKFLVTGLSGGKKWIELPQATRLSTLIFKLHHSPDTIHDLLENHWNQLGYIEQFDILSLLGSHPELITSSFLSTCMEKGKKNVRKSAAYILAQKPENDWQNRMKSRLAVALTYTETDGVAVSLPGQIDKSWSIDGIDAKERWNKRPAGESRLYLLISLCPPQWCEQILELSSYEIIEEVWEQEYFSTLLQAWTKAATSYSDADWASSLMEAWTDVHHDLGEPDLKSFIHSLPEDVYQSGLLTLLDRQTVLPYENMLVAQLLRYGTFTWTNKITTLFFKRLGLWLEHKRPHLIYPQAQQLFKTAAHKCPAHLAEYFKDRFPRHSKPWPNFGHMIDEFIEHMLRRQEIHKAFTADD